jgi:hypothetical protein
MAFLLLPIERATATILLRDNFSVSTASDVSPDVNVELSARQSGTLAPLPYTKGDEPVFSQVGNLETPDALLLAGRSAGLPGSVSLDHNFTESPGLGNRFVIAFDVDPVRAGTGYNTTQSAWVSINVGSTAAGVRQFPQFTDGIGLLLRGNGSTHAFDYTQNLGSSVFAPGGSDERFHRIMIQVSDLVDGNPFDGSGSTQIQAFADSSSAPFLSHVRQNGFTANFISFVGEGEGNGGDGVVRHAITNLVICTQPNRTPGDANCDGNVNSLDFNAFTGSYGILSNATWQMGDFDADGKVTSTDLNLLAGNFGVLSARHGSPVPEPVTCVGVFVMLGLMRRRSMSHRGPNRNS